MEIRKAVPADAEILAPLFDLYRQFYNRQGDIEAAFHFIRERLTKHESVVFIASLDGRAVGFVQLYPSFSSVSLRRSWILNDLFVHPEARRKSVARKLIEKAVEMARETGARSLTLKTTHENQAAQKLYEAMGWKRDARFCNYDFVTE